MWHDGPLDELWHCGRVWSWSCCLFAVSPWELSLPGQQLPGRRLGSSSLLVLPWLSYPFIPCLVHAPFQWSLAASSPLSLSVLYLGSVQNKYIMWLNSMDSGQVDRLQIRLLRVSLFQLCSNLLPDTGLTWVFLPASAHVSYLQNRVFTTCGFFKSFRKEFCRFFHLEKAGKTP